MSKALSHCMVEDHAPRAGAEIQGTELKPKRRLTGQKGDSDPAFAYEAFMSTIERLEGLLEEESVSLRNHKFLAIDEFNQRKSLGLLEMRRAFRLIREFRFNDLRLDVKPAVARLRKKLQDNLCLLQIHLDAVAAIAGIIARSIEQQESDGTYSPDHVLKARQP